MKKNYSSILIFCFFCTLLKAQTQSISFEPSENFIDGPINGQNGWSVTALSSQFPVNSVIITNSKASDGAFSLKMPSSGEVYQDVIISKDVSTYYNPANDHEISMDLYITDQAIVQFAINDNPSDTSTYSGGIIINEFGSISVFADGDLINNVATFSNNTWVNFKIIEKKSTNVIEYYLDNNLIYSCTLGQYNNIGVLNFDFYDAIADHYVDNIKMTNISATMSTKELSSQNAVQIYPNPASDKVNIKAVEDIENIALYDVKGSLIRDFGKVDSSSIDISNIASGNYILKIKTKNSQIIKKVIKK